MLRAVDRENTADFYRVLGLNAHEHSHEGPLHFELGPTDPQCVAEIYKRSEKFPKDALMVKVPSLQEVLYRLGLSPEIKNVGDMSLAYISDPDDRTVMLYEVLVDNETGDPLTSSEATCRLENQRCLPCGGSIPPLTGEEIEEYLSHVDKWVLIGNSIQKIFHFKNFVEACAFISSLVPISEEENHHPDIHLENYREIRLCLVTHAISALSINDFILAAKFDALVK